jgi:chromate reductase
MKGFRILGLAGSLRRASVHRDLLRAAHEIGPEWMSCESFDLGRIPYFFDQDVEDEGTLKAVEELREKIRAHDAVLIATRSSITPSRGSSPPPWTGRCAPVTIPRL